MAFQEDEDVKPFKVNQSYQSKNVAPIEETEEKMDELDMLEEQILNDDGEVDYEKIRQLDKKGI